MWNPPKRCAPAARVALSCAEASRRAAAPERAHAAALRRVPRPRGVHRAACFSRRRQSDEKQGSPARRLRSSRTGARDRQQGPARSWLSTPAPQFGKTPLDVAKDEATRAALLAAQRRFVAPAAPKDEEAQPAQVRAPTSCPCAVLTACLRRAAPAEPGATCRACCCRQSRASRRRQRGEAAWRRPRGIRVRRRHCAAPCPRCAGQARPAVTTSGRVYFAHRRQLGGGAAGPALHRGCFKAPAADTWSLLHIHMRCWVHAHPRGYCAFQSQRELARLARTVVVVFPSERAASCPATRQHPPPRPAMPWRRAKHRAARRRRPRCGAAARA